MTTTPRPSADAASNKAEEVSDMSKKTLIAYFSASGTTARLAATLAELTGANLYEIKPADPYNLADLNWNNKSSRSSLEMADTSSRPAISDSVSNMAQYDAVLIGFPIWWYEAPRIIATFLEAYDFSGKILAAFATSGGSGMGNTDNILQALCPNAQWKTGKRFSVSVDRETLQAWVDSLGLS